MTIQARYVHTNLIAKDWRVLTDFYVSVFGCVPLESERDYRGDDLDVGTGLAGAHLQGVHLRLPGYGEGGPTLEIYTYSPQEEARPAPVNRPGFGHIAFEVDDVSAAREQVLAAGGTSIGEVVTLRPSANSKVTWCYVRDVEGNIIELQAWH